MKKKQIKKISDDIITLMEFGKQYQTNEFSAKQIKYIENIIEQHVEDSQIKIEKIKVATSKMITSIFNIINTENKKFISAKNEAFNKIEYWTLFKPSQKFILKNKTPWNEATDELEKIKKSIIEERKCFEKFFREIDRIVIRTIVQLPTVSISQTIENMMSSIEKMEGKVIDLEKRTAILIKENDYIDKPIKKTNCMG